MTEGNQTNGHRDPDTFDVKAALRACIDAARYHWGTVLLTCILTLALVTLYVWVWPPIYLVKASIMIEQDIDVARDAFYVDWNVFRKHHARTEMELMKSAPVLLEVIDRENLTYDDVYHPVMSQLSYFWEQSWVGKRYKAIKNVIFSEEVVVSPEEAELGKTLQDLRAAIKIQPEGDSYVGTLKMKGPSPRVASVVNTLLDVYMERRSEIYQTEAQRSYDTLTEELDRTAGELREIERERLAFAGEHGVQIDLTKETLEIQQLAEIEARMAESRELVASLESRLDEVERQLETEPPTMTISSITELNAVREAAKLKHLEFQTALVTATDLYRDDSPEIQEIRRDLAELDAILKEEPEKLERGTTEGLNTIWQQLVADRGSLQSQLAGARAGLAVMNETAGRLRARLANLPILQTTLHNLAREYNLAGEKYQTLALRRAQAMVSLTTTGGAMPSMRVVGYARPPASKWWPRLKYVYPAGLMVGLLLGLAAALTVRYTSGRIHRADVEHGRGLAPLYGTVGVATESPPLAVVRGGKASAGKS